MGTLKNVSKHRLGVVIGGETAYLAPGEAVEAEGAFDSAGCVFVQAGWLECEGVDVAGPGAGDGGGNDGEKPDPIVVTDITGEDGVFTVRAADGVEFKPAKNQVREDGTLTDGGIKAYEAAKAAQSAE